MIPTQRLYWEEPRRKTALAAVTGHASGGFLLDRTVFHCHDARYHHAQPSDRGHVIADGHKLKIHKVGWTARGDLAHRTDGPLPPAGAKAQLHLDADRRDLQARAHLLGHLLLQALAESRAEILATMEVVGGGEVKLAATLREAPQVAWPKIDARVRQLVAARETVETKWMPRDEAARAVTPQGVPLDAVGGGEPTLRIVKVGGSVLPCDAPLPERSSDVRDWRLAPPAAASANAASLPRRMPGNEGVRLRAKVVA